MHASNPETIYFAGSGDWTQARLITVSGCSAHCANEPHGSTYASYLDKLTTLMPGCWKQG